VEQKESIIMEVKVVGQNFLGGAVNCCRVSGKSFRVLKIVWSKIFSFPTFFRSVLLTSVGSKFPDHPTCFRYF